MITALLGIIGRTPWGMSALLYTALGLLITCIGLGVTVDLQSARLDAAKARVDSLGDKIATQNRAVATWKAEAGKQELRAKTAAKKAEQVRTITVERVRTVTVASIPPACLDAIRWGAEHALELNKRWTQETGLKEDEE